MLRITDIEVIPYRVHVNDDQFVAATLWSLAVDEETPEPDVRHGTVVPYIRHPMSPLRFQSRKALWGTANICTKSIPADESRRVAITVETTRVFSADLITDEPNAHY